jgi:hypothetical protein
LINSRLGKKLLASFPNVRLRILAAIFAVACAYAGGRQFMEDRDRREISELTKIQPPPGATELKLILAFPTSKQEEAGVYLSQPDSFIRDSLGNYYIADQKTNVIYKYDCSGSILRRYSFEGKMLKEQRLKTEFSFQKEKINLRMNSYLPDHKAGNYVVFAAAEILDEVIYLVDHVPPRLWIWALDADFRVTHTYWANTGDYLFARDFVPFRENGQIHFALLGSLTPYEEKISIFSPKK